METAATSISGQFEAIDYEDLNQGRLRRIAKFFGVPLPEAETTLSQLAEVYSKDPGKGRRFEDDRARKQAAATPEIRAAARTWAMAFYNQIHAMA